MFSENEESVKNFTRGGQTFLHSFRMLSQIFDRVLSACFFIFFGVLGVCLYFSIQKYEWYLVGQWLFAHLISPINPDATQQMMEPDGTIIQVTVSEIINSVLIHSVLEHIKMVVAKAVLYASGISLFFMTLIYQWLKRRGKIQTEDKKIRGDEIGEVKDTNKLIKASGEISKIKIGTLVAPRAFETQHMLFHGTSGSGKSQHIYALLEQIRRLGYKAIIYDKGGNYIRYFHQAGDVILNPLDHRTASWLLWAECRDSTDFDSLAAALIPMPLSTQDPFWVNAARTIFAAAAFEMRNDPKKSIIKLLRYLLNADLDILQRYLKGTEAETLVSEKTEKTAISIKAVLATYLKSLKYVKDDGEPFSIRQWIQDETKSNWLFISSLSDRHETLKPFISMCLDIAVNSIMSLTEDYDRRIFVVLDELPTLQKLPYLPEAFAESRKYGGCLVAGMQSISQARKIYGNSAAEEISGLCNTRIFLRTPSSETAKWVAMELGEEEIEETREGYSYSESSMRSGISLSRQNTRRQIVSYSEIMRLKNLESYVRLPGNFPITKLTITYQQRDDKAASFIRRHLDDKSIAEIDEQINAIEKLAHQHQVSVPKDNILESELFDDILQETKANDALSQQDKLKAELPEEALKERKKRKNKKLDMIEKASEMIL